MIATRYQNVSPTRQYEMSHAQISLGLWATVAGLVALGLPARPWKRHTSDTERSTLSTVDSDTKAFPVRDSW